MHEIVLDGKLVNDDTDAYVIAEIGHNHQGKVKVACDMIKAAKDCGADAVKLQKRDNKSLFTRAGYDKPYENENSYGATYGEHRDALEFNDEYVELMNCARENEITLFATAFDIKSAEFLDAMGMPFFKVASGDLKNIPLLKHIANLGKPMIVSTGGANIVDVERAVGAIVPVNDQLAILQCTAGYPAEFEDLHLSVITKYRRLFPYNVIGLSSHDSGIAMAVAAYVLGARIIEKHFTLNRAWKGTDHAFSLEPVGLRKMVRDLKRTRVAMGDDIKRVLASERDPITKMGKRLVAACYLPVGHVVTVDDIAIKSPGGGMEPYQLDLAIGCVVKNAVMEDEPIENAF